MIIVLFLIGLFCFLTTLGYVSKLALGLKYDESFVADFVTEGFIIFGKITVVSVAILFVYIIVSLVQTL